MNSILYVGLDVQTTNYTICTYEPEYDRILLLESFLPCLLLFFFDIKHSPYVDNVFISCLLNKAKCIINQPFERILLCSKCKVFAVFTAKTLHLLCERFAQQAGIPMDAVVKICDFDRKSVRKRFFTNADGVSAFVQ